MVAADLNVSEEEEGQLFPIIVYLMIDEITDVQ